MDDFAGTRKGTSVKPADGGKLDPVPSHSLRHLKASFESENRREYVCGCYHRRSKSVWSFFPGCPGHKRQVREQWDARPWYGKLAAYALLGWLFVLFAGGLWMIIRLLYLVVAGK